MVVLIPYRDRKTGDPMTQPATAVDGPDRDDPFVLFGNAAPPTRPRTIRAHHRRQAELRALDDHAAALDAQRPGERGAA